MTKTDQNASTAQYPGLRIAQRAICTQVSPLPKWVGAMGNLFTQLGELEML